MYPNILQAESAKNKRQVALKNPCKAPAPQARNTLRLRSIIWIKDA
jgi:hypothetical protein